MEKQNQPFLLLCVSKRAFYAFFTLKSRFLRSFFILLFGEETTNLACLFLLVQVVTLSHVNLAMAAFGKKYCDWFHNER